MGSASNLVLLEENNSEFFEVNESGSFINNDGSHTSFSQIIPENHPNNNYALNQYGNSETLLDPALDYIRRYLLEEDVDGDISGCQEGALRDMEKTFYDILGEKYTPSQDKQLPTNRSRENPDFTICISKDKVGPNFNDSLKQHSSTENLFATEFHRGAEEGTEFLPNLNQLSIDLQVRKISFDPTKKCDRSLVLGQAKEGDLPDRPKGKKSSDIVDLDISEGRNRKIPMVPYEETIRDEMFDKVLLNQWKNYAREEASSLREITELEANYCNKNQNQYYHGKLKDLLIYCAETVSTNNRNAAIDTIKQIRKQASHVGDGIQRLACILADGLEARLNGTGSAIYRQLAARRISTTEYLKAYHMGMSITPLMRVAYHFANKNILSIAGNASKIHIVDFGISFGFQWPSLIQLLAKMKDGPPRIRITGVDLPQPGFHPAERIIETGKRLEDYARDFEVPFEYHGIASRWESICIEDLCINDDEVLIVNSMFNLSQLKSSPSLDTSKSRNELFNLIRAIKPKVFIQGIFNFSFSPFFIPRFKMVLMEYFRFFDMLDTMVPRNSNQRFLIETEFFRPPIMNQIACEGSNLVVTPETYKKCHLRNLEIGFEQLPVDPSIVKECSEVLINDYDERFFIEEDCNWFLQGWKGSIIYAVSLWKPQVE
ncbi:hypothetical protein LUZ63_010801 [Rhynchospora breviuscula]|uniref:GRAS family transcription factor n=1 Tax=Rhynchospora breviuscula TaxID=2022672 RepID=A0A9Q0CHP7_9POAL|nr:hypothetical protein LUZ63_010801 [Rhynchospora breviuscula]